MEVVPLRSISISYGRRLAQEAEPLEEEVVKIERIESPHLGRIALGKAGNQVLMVRYGTVFHLLC